MPCQRILPSASISAHTASNRRFVALAMQGRHQEVARFLQYGEWAVEAGMDVGADPALMADIAGHLHTTVTNLVAAMRRDLDDAGLEPDDAEINMTYLSVLLEEIGK
jgi:hypothetical protein